jgi:hypothetical protein
MSQDRDTGAAGNDFGRDCGEMIANLLCAEKIKKGRSSNECLLKGKRVVLKCSQSKKPQQIAVYSEMFDRLDAVVAAFKNPDGSYHIYEMSLEAFKRHMRFREYEHGDRV